MILNKKVSTKALKAIKIPADVIDLISKILSKNPKERPTHEEILGNELFTNPEAVKDDMNDAARKEKLKKLGNVSMLTQLKRQIQE